MQASVVMKDCRLVLPINFSIFRTLLLDLSVVTSVQSERVGCTGGCWYFVLLNNHIGTVTWDVYSEVQVSGRVDWEVNLIFS